MKIQFVELENICTSITDGTHYTPPSLGSGIPFLTVKDMTEDGLNFSSCSFMSEDEYEKAKRGKSSPQVGDVLFSKDGTVGKIHVVRESREFAVLSSIAILTPNSNIADSEYLGRILATQQILDEATKRKTGSAIRRIILKDLKQVKIPLPPIAQQKRIAAILDKADAVRRKRREAIRLTEELLRSTFLEMFGDPVTNPKGWPSCRLTEAVKFMGGSQPEKKYFSDHDGDNMIRLVQIRDFRTDKYKTYIPQEKAKRFFKEEDIMIGRYGPPIFQIFRGLSGSYNVALMKAEPRKELEKEYIFWMLSSDSVQNFVISNSQRTAGQSGVNMDVLSALFIAIPPLDLQIKHSRISRHISASLSLQEKLFKESENLFNSLLQRAFTGDL
jgi:type I restriction enzyme S subunit